MTRWLVQLEGNQCDLEEFPYWFPDGDAYAIEESGSMYLVGPVFEDLSEASQVREVALQIVDEFSAIITLLWSSLQRPKVGRVFREDDSGQRRAFIFLSAAITGRSKTRARATLIVDGVAQDQRSPTQAQILFSGARMDTHLRVAISLWADPIRTWPRLYRVLEEIEQYLGQPVQKARFCSDEQRKRFDEQRKRFKHSANAAEISGKDARHALGKFQPRKDPMNLTEATVFIGELLQAALAHAAAGQLPKSDTV